jgi:asparagine synthase (glutamine-hydrolysing)
MCGIVGKVNFDAEQPVDPCQIRQMAESLRHRGPDDEGVWTEANVGLGHRRLSIIDLSADGRNPMCNEDGSVWIVFNGEIYNFLEIRPKLEAAGHRFRSRTDTEVILHLYEECGPDCVKRLRGMFAFAIWDSRLRQLLLARDRLGVKPLFYSLTPRGLLFGSEIKAILGSSEIQPAPDLVSIHQFLLWQCIPSPRTGFREISKLPPASILTWQQGKDLRIQKYWVPDFSRQINASEQELTEEVREMVQKATELRLIADVPVGVFLSGGIDSACVLAAARRSVCGKIQTFSVAFGPKEFDESPYARRLAQHFETDHHELKVTPEAIQLLPKIAALFDEPFADSSAIPTYYLAEYTSRHVKVALSGDGGDEAFGGYQRYLALKGFELLSRFPGSHWLPAFRALLPDWPVGRSRQRYVRELLEIVNRPPREQYRAIFLAMMDSEAWRTLYTDSFRNALDHLDGGNFLYGWDESRAPDNLTRAMAADTLSYIPADLNVKVDICSMASSLEVRSPFLDHELVEFCARIPTRFKIHYAKQKCILKSAFAKELPSQILKRGKAGFAIPISEWFRNELRDFARDTLLSAENRLGEMFRVEKLKTMLDEHAAGKRNWHHQLWRLLILATWFHAHSATGQKRIA